MSQILCVAAWPGVPSVAPCKQRDVHLETCTNDDCKGCFPRSADRGFLCAPYFDRLEHAYARWDEFTRQAGALGLSRAVQRDNGGVRTTADGRVNLTGIMLALDECHRHLASAAGHRSLELWVSTEGGASDAIQFAAAAERAYRSHEITERPHRLSKAVCPTFECGGVLVWTPPAWFEKPVTIRCQDCGATVPQDAYDEGAASS